VDSPIREYLDRLRRELRGHPLLARRVVEEIADHLAAAAEHERSAGLDPGQAEANAVRRLGPAEQIARQLDPYDLPLRGLVAFWTMATAAVALWLLSVIVLVLPARDPAHVPLWLLVAAGFCAYSGLCVAYLVRGPRRGVLKWSVLALSCGAIAAGLFGMATMVRIARAGGDFEGYVLLMGIILCGHGLSVIAHAVITAGVVRRLRSA
jgi:hypothetical protein